MKKQTQLLSALALSVELILSASFQAVASIPDQVVDQAPLPSLTPMLEKVLPAVVSVRVGGTASQGQKVPEEFKKFFGDDLPDQPAQPFEGLGSGVIINANKDYALANNHVINRAQKINIQLSDGREFDAELIGGDDQSDITLLQIQNPNKLMQVAIVDSDKLRIDDSAVAVGNPFGLGQTATSDIISTLDRNGLDLGGLESFIQTDASINRGNSDGVLLNLNDELVGINTAILAPGGGSIGIGFTIPSNMTRTLAQQLVDFGEIKRGLLDIKGTEMSVDIVKAFNLDVQHGALVDEVLPGSGLARAGVKAGNIITSLNDKPLNSFAELHFRIATTEPDTRVKLDLLRNGKPLEVEVMPDTSTSSLASTEMIMPMLGGAILSDSQLKGGSRDIKIDEAVRGSPAAQAGLQKDDVIIGVNRDRVSLIAETHKMLAAEPAVIALQIVRDNESPYLLMH